MHQTYFIKMLPHGCRPRAALPATPPCPAPPCPSPSHARASAQPATRRLAGPAAPGFSALLPGRALFALLAVPLWVALFLGQLTLNTGLAAAAVARARNAVRLCRRGHPGLSADRGQSLDRAGHAARRLPGRAGFAVARRPRGCDRPGRMRCTPCWICCCCRWWPRCSHGCCCAPAIGATCRWPAMLMLLALANGLFHLSVIGTLDDLAHDAVVRRAGADRDDRDA